MELKRVDVHGKKTQNEDGKLVDNRLNNFFVSQELT